MEFTTDKINNVVEMMNSTEEDQNVALEILNDCDIENNIIPILIILKLQYKLTLYNIEIEAPRLHQFVMKYVTDNIISFNTIIRVINKLGDSVTEDHKDVFNTCVNDFLYNVAQKSGMTFVDGVSTKIKVNDKDRITS